MDILLDTHTLLWMITGDPRLRAKQHQVLENPENRLFVSAISAFEIATKVRIGKLKVGMPLPQFFQLVYLEFGYLSLPVSHQHGQLGGSIPGPHRDPFDRLLAGQALEERMPLMTDDPAFKAFGVEVVW